MKKRQAIFLILLAVLSIAALVIMWSLEPNKDKAIKALLSVNKYYLYAALAVMAVFVSVEGFNCWYMLRNMDKTRINLFQSIRVGLMIRCYNSITPFGTGGQPYMVYAFSKMGVPSSVCTSVLLVKYILHQSIYCIFAVTAYTIARHTVSLNGAVWIFGALGVMANVIIPLSMIAFSINQKAMHKVVYWCARFLSKLHVKGAAHFADRAEHFVCDYRKGIKLLVKMPKVVAVVLTATFIELTTSLLVPYLVYLSFSPVDPISYIRFSSVYLFLFLSIAVMPTPGGAGVAESGFALIFSQLFPPNTAIPGMFVWRGITFYLLLLTGGVNLMVNSIRRLLKKDNIGGITKDELVKS